MFDPYVTFEVVFSGEWQWTKRALEYLRKMTDSVVPAVSDSFSTETTHEVNWRSSVKQRVILKWHTARPPPQPDPCNRPTIRVISLLWTRPTYRALMRLQNVYMTLFNMLFYYSANKLFYYFLNISKNKNGDRLADFLIYDPIFFAAMVILYLTSKIKVLKMLRWSQICHPILFTN